MKLIRAAAVAGIASTVYKQAKKPENQAKIKRAVAKARSSRSSAPASRSPFNRSR